MSKRIKLLTLVILLGYIIVAFVIFKNDQKTLAACCPGEPGCGGGTCYGYRINPPGGCGCYTEAEGCAPGCGGGGGETCGNGSCGSGESCSSCPGDCGACCTVSRPGVTTLVSPANGTVISNNSVTLSYANYTGWGNGCPNTNSFHVMYSENCSGIFIDNGSNTTLTNLTWGATYCWKVRKNNGGAWDDPANVTTWRFTVNNTPVLTGSGILSDACGSGISGSTSSQSAVNNVTNPITWQMSFQDTDSNSTFRILWFALVPSTGPYAETRLNAPYTDILAKANNSSVQAISFKYYFEGASGTGAINLWNSTSEWGTTRSGDLTNSFGTIRIKNINTATRGYFPTANSVSANFQLEFLDTMPAGNYNIYAAAVVENPGPVYVCSYATPTNPWIFRRIGNWSVDTRPPVATVSNPTYKTDGTFDVTWKASDNYSGVVDLRSYIYADASGGALHDNTNGLDISPPATEMNYPAGSNAGITIAEATLASPAPHNYVDNTAGVPPTYGYKLVLKDSACNIGTAVNSFSPPSPWLVAYGNSISANGGITNIRIPDVASFQVPPYITDPINTPFLSTYSALSGTTNLPSNKQSKFREYALNYINDGITPPIRSGYTNWYDYFYNLVGKNGSIINTIAVDPGFSNPAETLMSGLLSATAGGKIVVNITDNLTLKSGITCNVRAIVFVEGDLSIDPDFLNTGNNACVFIVRGNVSIGGGVAKSAAGSSAYDEIYALIFTDSIFNAESDSTSVASECPTASATLVRQLTLGASQTSPNPTNGINLPAGKYKFVYNSGAWSPSSTAPDRWYANFALSKKTTITSLADLTMVGTGSTVYTTRTSAEAAGIGKFAILNLPSVPSPYPNVYVFVRKTTPPLLVGGVRVDIYQCPGSPVTNYYTDGLYIKGGIISSGVTLLRSLSTDKNLTLPSIIFDYDPVYKEEFKTEFSTRNYSIREVLE